jgi:chorismate synthase
MFFNQRLPSLKVKAFTQSIGPVEQKKMDDLSIINSEDKGLGFLDQTAFNEAERLLKKAKTEGESYGGCVEVRVFNPPPGLGEPVFKKIKSKLAEAMLSIGAVKSFSLGEDVNLSDIKGTEYHSMPISVYGGVQGGMSTGDTIIFNATVKPTSSILDVAKKGRHDPCIVPRALVVMEAMTYLVLMDLFLYNKIYSNSKNNG